MVRDGRRLAAQPGRPGLFRCERGGGMLEVAPPQ
jgi:hypothetical protein